MTRASAFESGRNTAYLVDGAKRSAKPPFPSRSRSPFSVSSRKRAK
jgi:hypothetical protein